MLGLLRVLGVTLEWAVLVPMIVARWFADAVLLNPSLRWIRWVFYAAFAYVVFAVVLVYVVAPIRGFAGQYWLAEKLRYDSERWLATAIYDRDGSFVGTFDPMLDSKRDVNYTGVPIEMATGYIANPDHKSIPVREVPEFYWQCLVYHEDRNVGGLLNPFGIDLFGVLKIPVSSISLSLQAGAPRIGVGGSTLPMQLTRVIYQTPPRASESAFEKLNRKFGEWWDAPVLYWALSKGGNLEPLKQWTANHLWLAQRTGGSPLHGIEMTSRIVFGKPAAELSPAEQFVLASAVNKPIILLEGSEKLNAVRLDRWRYIVDVRARKCASELLPEAEQKRAWFELTQIANGPPDPQVKPKLQAALDEVAPTKSKAAQANPVLRANVLIPDARYGVREEMKGTFGFGWREQVRGVGLTLDVAQNLRFRERIKTGLSELQGKFAAFLDPGYTLDPALVLPDGSMEMPNVIIAAANAKGEIVRYFEAKDIASYFGSPFARDAETGRYHPALESRAIASVGKMIAAMALANEGRDTMETQYQDPELPSVGIDTCRHDGGRTGPRPARVAFACSLNKPIEWRLAQLGQEPVRKLIDGFGFTMPVAASKDEETPPTTAAVRGLITGSPRTVHHMAAVVLAALTGRGGERIPAPSLVRSYDKSMLSADRDDGRSLEKAMPQPIVPNKLIRAAGHAMLRNFLSSPLCNLAGGKPEGTLKSLAGWCAGRRADVKLHIAKTGTQVTIDPDQTVDAWVAGGIQFANGQTYSYVAVVGTGSTSKPWARKLHAAQVTAPLVEILLRDLAGDKQAPLPVKLNVQPEVSADETAPAVIAPPARKRKIKKQRLASGN